MIWKVLDFRVKGEAQIVRENLGLFLNVLFNDDLVENRPPDRTGVVRLTAQQGLCWSVLRHVARARLLAIIG